MEKVIPDDITKELYRWNLIALFHRMTHVALGLIGVLCPLVVATFADILATWQVRALSFAASASIALFAAFEIGNLATRWREAWKHLNSAILEYKLDIIDAPGLTKAYREGEAIIGKMKSDPFTDSTKQRVE